MNQIELNQRLDLPMPDAPVVSAGNIANFALPIGRRFHELSLLITGTNVTLAHISKIQVIANEKPIHTYTAVERDDMNQFDGRAPWHKDDNPFLIIPFDRYGMENSVLAQETAIDTGPIASGNKGRKIRTFGLEVTLKSDAPADMALKLEAKQSMSLGRGAGTVMHVIKSHRSTTGAGEKDFSDLPVGDKVTTQALGRVFIKPSAGQINNCIIEIDTRKRFQRSKLKNERMQIDGVRVPQAGYYVVDRSENGQSGNRLNLVGVQDFRYILDLSAAAELTFLQEYYGGLGD